MIENISSESNKRFSIRSPSLKVDDQSNLPEDERIPEIYRNVVYCKLMAPAEALRWIYTITDRD